MISVVFFIVENERLLASVFLNSFIERLFTKKKGRKNEGKKDQR